MADFLEGIPQPQPPRRDLWHLPRILDVDIALKRYRKPRIGYRGLERVEHRQAVEIVVTTTAPFPARALSPVLYVGDEPVADWEQVGPNAYRFYAFAPERLADDAPLALGWPNDAGERRAAKQRFRLGAAQRRRAGGGQRPRPEPMA